jgi:hypothetical protein
MFLIFNPLSCLKLCCLAFAFSPSGYLLAINVLIVEVDDANGNKHKIASNPENVYCPSLHHRSASHHE